MYSLESTGSLPCAFVIDQNKVQFVFAKQSL